MVKISMVSEQDLQYAFCSLYSSWARSHCDCHNDCVFYIYTFLMYTNTDSIEAE